MAWKERHRLKEEHQGQAHRFITLYEDGTLATETKILQDALTGVQYLYYGTIGGGGLTPLIDQAGHPVVSPVFREEEIK